MKEVHLAKLIATEMANNVVYEAVQIHGGYGFMQEYEVERVYRDVRLISYGESSM